MNHKDIIQQFGAVALAAEIGQKADTVRKWHTRGRIPAEHWAAVVSAAHRLDLPVTYRTLAETIPARESAA